MAVRDVKLGRILIPTIFDDVVESLGDPVAPVGGSVLAAERRTRPFTVNLPLEGTMDEANPYTAGGRMRRQLRSLIENSRAKLAGLYFTFAQDSELNGWLVPGTADIKYAEGGPFFNRYVLSLSDCFRLGSRRTLRKGIRVEAYDRRLSTTPRDYLQTLYSTDFAAQTALALHHLPVGVTELQAPAVQGGGLSYDGLRAGFEGSTSFMLARTHGEPILYEQTEAQEGLADVVAYDRRTLAPQAVWAGPAAAQDYGWEELYGADYPLSAEDGLVLENGLCRVRFGLTSAYARHLAIDAYVASSSAKYVEQCRLQPQVTIDGSSWLAWATLTYARLVEWSPERAVIKVRGASTYAWDMYVTLQRGWKAPRIEVYTTTSYGVRVLVHPSAAIVTLVRGGLLFRDPYSGSLLLGVQTWAAAASEPWAAMFSASASYYTIAAAVLQSGTQLRDTYDGANSMIADGAARFGFAIENPLAGSGYVSATLGFSSTGLDFEAESALATGSGGSTPDAAASGGNANYRVTNAVEGTQLTKVLAGGVLALGKYAVYVRVKVSAGTATLKLYYTTGSSALAATVTTASTLYVWLKLGEITHTASVAPGQLDINTFNSGGYVYLDRVLVVPTEGRSAGAPYDGPRDLGQTNLIDSRSVPILAQRA